MYVVLGYERRNQFDGVVDLGEGVYPPGLVLRAFPSPSLLKTSLEGIDASSPLVDNLLLAGIGKDGRYSTVLYDTATDTEKTLLPPEQNIRVLSLGFSAKDSQVWFQGVRMSDAKTVVGRVGVSGGPPLILETPTGVVNFQTFAN